MAIHHRGMNHHRDQQHRRCRSSEEPKIEQQQGGTGYQGDLGKSATHEQWHPTQPQHPAADAAVPKVGNGSEKIDGKDDQQQHRQDSVTGPPMLLQPSVQGRAHGSTVVAESLPRIHPWLEFG